MTNATFPALTQILWPAQDGARWGRAIALIVGGAAMLTAAAKIQIPFYPVPQTLQTMVVLLIGMSFGARLGAAAAGLYVAIGAAGLPVFAANPFFTGGYLLGFVVAAAICGMLAERGWDSRLWKVAAAMCIGNVVMYIFGLPWLAIAIGAGGEFANVGFAALTNDNFAKAIAAGLIPFVFGDLLKIAFAAVALPPIVRAVRGR